MSRKTFELRSGSRRWVILCGKRVIKIPRMNNWVAFIKGVTENLEERYWWSADGNRKRDPKRAWTHDFLAEIYWADRFGLMVFAKRLDTNTEVASFENDLKNLRMRCKGFGFEADVTDRNVGYDTDGKLKVLDYGWHGGSMDCYLGT